MITDWKSHKDQLLQDPQLRPAYDDLEVEFQRERAIIEARLNKAEQSKLNG